MKALSIAQDEAMVTELRSTITKREEREERTFEAFVAGNQR